MDETRENRRAERDRLPACANRIAFQETVRRVQGWLRSEFLCLSSCPETRFPKAMKSRGRNFL